MVINTNVLFFGICFAVVDLIITIMFFLYNCSSHNASSVMGVVNKSS